MIIWLRWSWFSITLGWSQWQGHKKDYFSAVFSPAKSADNGISDAEWFWPKTPLIVNVSHISNMPQRQKYSRDIASVSREQKNRLRNFWFSCFQSINSNCPITAPPQLDSFLHAFSYGRAPANKHRDREFICMPFLVVYRGPNKDTKQNF